MVMRSKASSSYPLALRLICINGKHSRAICGDEHMKTNDVPIDARAKGSDRIQINGILSGICIGVLSVILTLSDKTISEIVIIQLAMAVPCLTTSSLAYAKTCYRDMGEFNKWDTLGWLTNTLGYIMVLNSMAFLLYQSKYYLSTWIFIGTEIVLFAVYSIIDAHLKHSRIKEKVLKIIFYYFLIFLGSVLPILSMGK